MSEYDDTNTFVLFQRDKKGDNHPDRGGEATIKCPHCAAVFKRELAGWIKHPKKGGSPFLSGTVSEPYEKKQERQPGSDDDGLDIPF